MNSNLFNYIKRYIDISESEVELFETFLKKRTVKKKEYLLKVGEICEARYFITKGCFQFFYIDKKGNEQIIHFGIDNWWITDFDSLINQVPSNLNIQALEDSKLLELNQESFEELCKRLPKTERFFRIITEKTYIASQKRIEYMFNLSGEEMYEKFVTANPEFVQRVPQYMIASYLGFTPEYLSGLRKK